MEWGKKGEVSKTSRRGGRGGVEGVERAPILNKNFPGITSPVPNNITGEDNIRFVLHISG